MPKDTVQGQSMERCGMSESSYPFFLSVLNNPLYPRNQQVRRRHGADADRPQETALTPVRTLPFHGARRGRL
jgi:hypothetical protein